MGGEREDRVTDVGAGVGVVVVSRRGEGMGVLLLLIAAAILPHDIHTTQINHTTTNNPHTAGWLYTSTGDLSVHMQQAGKQVRTIDRMEQEMVDSLHRLVVVLQCSGQQRVSRDANDPPMRWNHNECFLKTSCGSRSGL